MPEEFFNKEERVKARSLARILLTALSGTSPREQRRRLVDGIAAVASGGTIERDRFGFNPVLSAMDTAVTLCKSVDADLNMVLAVMLSSIARAGNFTYEKVVCRMGRGRDRALCAVSTKSPDSTGVHLRWKAKFRKLLLTFAEI